MHYINKVCTIYRFPKYKRKSVFPPNFISSLSHDRPMILQDFLSSREVTHTTNIHTYKTHHNGGWNVLRLYELWIKSAGIQILLSHECTNILSSLYWTKQIATSTCKSYACLFVVLGANDTLFVLVTHDLFISFCKPWHKILPCYFITVNEDLAILRFVFHSTLQNVHHPLFKTSL